MTLQNTHVFAKLTNITDSFQSGTELPTCNLVVVIVSIDFQPCDPSEPLLHQYQRLKPQGNLVLWTHYVLLVQK